MISVIIVSYNTRAMTLDCLRRLYDTLGGLAAEVFVVDNASADGSAEAVRAAFPHVKVIENERNLGFGAANNVALAQARGEFLLLLNSDAFAHSGAIAALVDCLQRHPKAAVAGPRLLNADGSLQLSCFRFPTPTRCWLENLWVAAAFRNHPRISDYRRWPHDAEREVDSVTGACMLVRRAAYEQAGGFDERFFMYSEETDWQRTLRDHGWSVVFTPGAQVVHLAGASGALEKPRVSRHFFESLDKYLLKHHGRWGLLSGRLAMTLGCGLRAALWSLALLSPRRRETARHKSRFMGSLCVRHATHWRGVIQA